MGAVIFFTEVGQQPTWAAETSVFEVKMGGEAQLLRTWGLRDLHELKSSHSKEIDPATRQLTPFRGVLLSQLLDRSMDSLSVEKKALVDLLVFKNAAGGEVVLPRSVVTRYPVLVALHDREASLVMPWTSKPKIQQEGLPVEKLFLPKITQLHLTNYREKFSGVFLKRRTDPLAMRGEKIFVQNCLSCHSDGQARRLGASGHPTAPGAPNLSEKDLRSLVNYLQAYRGENPTSGTSQFTKSLFKNVAEAATVR